MVDFTAETEFISDPPRSYLTYLTLARLPLKSKATSVPAQAAGGKVNLATYPAATVAVQAAGGRVNLAIHPAAIVAVQAAGGRVNLATHPAATSWVNMATQALLAKYPGSEASPSPNMTWTLALLTGLIVHSPPQQLSAELNVLAGNEDNQPGRQTMR